MQNKIISNQDFSNLKLVLSKNVVSFKSYASNMYFTFIEKFS